MKDVSDLKSIEKPWYREPQSSLEVQCITNALKRAQQFKAFEYARVYNDNSGFLYFSDPRMIGYNEKNCLPITAPISPKLISSQFWYFLSTDGKYLEAHREWKEKFGIQTVANWISRSSGYYEMFSFGFAEDISIVSSHLLNSRALMEAWANQFRDSADPLLKLGEKEKTLFSDALLPNFRGFGCDLASEEHDDGQVEELLSVLLQEIQRVYRGKLKPVLSKQEFQCVRYLILGYTAKNIAQKLCLSPRTVEAYLESAKNKLGCGSKSEIIATILKH